MALLNARHPDPETAALSIAANRASKCELLRAEAAKTSDAEHAAWLIKMADRYASDLFFDVREWIGSTSAGTNASDQVCERLHEIVARARGSQ
jgi:hypothetical protein